jgi:hypothetical protein
VGVEPAPFAGAHNLAGVGNRGRPVEALAGRVAHKGARRRVVAAHARVYVSKELAPLRDGYASLQDAGRGALVQLAADESERLGHPGDAPSLGSVRGELPSIHPGDVLVVPVPLVGAGSVSMASATAAPYPSSKESTYASFEGSSSMGSVPVGLEGAPEGSP